MAHGELYIVDNGKDKSSVKKFLMSGVLFFNRCT